MDEFIPLHTKYVVSGEYDLNSSVLQLIFVNSRADYKTAESVFCFIFVFLV